MILKRYIYKEIAQRTLWILSILLLVLISIKLIGFLADAAAGKIPAQLILVLLAYKILSTLPKILPIILMLSTMLTFSLMARDKELVVLAATGIGKNFYIKITLYAALVYAGLAAFICFYLSPLAEQQLERIKETARQQADITNIIPGRFKEIGQKGAVFYIESRSPETAVMNHAFLHRQNRKNDNLDIIKSDTVRLAKDPDSGDRFAEFQHGRHYKGRPGSLNYRITEFEKYAILIEHGTAKKAKDGDFLRNLWRAETPAYKAEFHWRLGLVIACVLLALLSVALNLGRFIAIERSLLFAAAILIYLLYSNLLSIGMTMIKRELVSSAVGLWWAHALLLIGIVLLYYLPTMRWRRKRMGATAGNTK